MHLCNLNAHRWNMINIVYKVLWNWTDDLIRMTLRITNLESTHLKSNLSKWVVVSSLPQHFAFYLCNFLYVKP